MGTVVSMDNLHPLISSMIKIRAFETVALELFSSGKIRGTTHTCIGQEANAVGVVSCVGEEDYVFSNHRNHGHYLALTNDVYGLLHELLGDHLGVSSGIGGSQHIHSGRFFSSGILGGIVATAAGVAMGEKLRHSNNIVVCFLGDGAFGQGIVYETLNISSLWDLPILFVVENNKYAQSTPIKNHLAGTIVSRFQSFGVATDVFESYDVFEIKDRAEVSIELVRAQQKPFGFVIETYRLSPHSKGDDYRNIDEIEGAKKSDPLLVAAKKTSVDTYQEILQVEIDRIRLMATNTLRQ